MGWWRGSAKGAKARVNGPGHPSNPQQAANMRGRAPGGAGRDRGPQEQQPDQAVQEQEQDNQQEEAEEFSKGPLILTWSCQVLWQSIVE